MALDPMSPAVAGGRLEPRSLASDHLAADGPGDRRRLHMLLVSYRFPPQSSGGVLRPLKFAKHCSRQGVKVTVLTAVPAARIQEDRSLLREVPPEVTVIRVPERRLLPLLPESKGRWPLWTALDRRTRVALRYAIFHGLVPDDRAGFIEPAAALAADPRIHDVDVILATGQPWSCFLIGERLSARLRRPLVLDYRDPWTTTFAGMPRNEGLAAILANRRIERRVLRKAAAIVSVMEHFPSMLEEGLGLRGIGERFHWIPNGFDPEDFEGVEASVPETFTVTYSGSLYGGRRLGPVVAALEDLIAAGDVRREDVRLQVLGPPTSKVLGELGDSALRDRIVAPGRVTHAETLAAQAASAVNLLVDIIYDGPNIHVPGKLYEYLRSGRPVLAVSNPGLTSRLIEEAAGGWVVPPGDHAALKARLGEAYQLWRNGAEMPAPRREVVERFNRAHLAARLVAVLESVVAQSADPSAQPRGGGR